MKKLLGLLITLLLVLSLGACKSASSTTLENRVATLEEKVEALENINNNLVESVGLNGQTAYYTNQDDTKIYLSLSTFTLLATEVDYLDKSKFPDYIFDIDGEYIDIDNLGRLLVDKYFENPTHNAYETGVQYKLSFGLVNENMTNEEYIARLSMLIMELSYYDFYTIDTPQLYFYNSFNLLTVQAKVRMSLLVTDKYEFVEEFIYLELLDSEISGIEFDTELVAQYIETFKTNETFSGYVLDYK